MPGWGIPQTNPDPGSRATPKRSLHRAVGQRFRPGASAAPAGEASSGGERLVRLVLERELHLGPVRRDAAVLDVQVELLDLGHPQVAQAWAKAEAYKSAGR